jgi:membrane protein YdbS with pleckstrin-like domain
MEKLTYKKQEKSHLKLNRIILTVIFLIITIVSTGIMFIKTEEILFVIIALSVYVVIYGLLFYYLGAVYRHFSYSMNEYGLYINQGVFWRKKIIVPRNRVQHTDVTQGPLQRKYDLAELVVHTAGTRNASVRLPGILYQLAEDIRESLSFEESNDAV